MSGTDQASLGAALDLAAAALDENPSDLGQWLQVASLLAVAGRRDEGAAAFGELGEAASDLGQVALAVACARWLEQHGYEVAAATLLRDVAAVHCQGSEHIDSEAKPRPPGPPRAADDRPPTENGVARNLDEAVARAQAAIAAAAADAGSRAPARLPSTPLVHVLAVDEFLAMASVMTLHAHPAGTVVLDAGQPADALYWVARGSLRVSRGGAELGELRANTFFGEISMVGGTARTATVTCAEDTWLLRIPAEDVEKTAVRAPKLAKVLAAHARARILANVMRTSELFSRLSEAQRAELLPRFDTYLAEAGTTVISRGAENDHLYVIASGRCEVRDADRGVLATVGVGEGVGEISLIARRPAVADVVALERTVFLRLPRSEFEHIAIEHPSLLAEVYKLLIEREEANQSVVVHDASDLIV